MSEQGNVQIDAVSTATTGTSTVSSLSWTHTVASESNRMALIAVMWKDIVLGGITVADATFNGVSVDGVITTWATTLNDIFIELYYLKTPAIGTYTATITWTGAGASAVAAMVSCYNVKQSAPVDSSVADGSTSPTFDEVTGRGLDSLSFSFITAFKGSSSLTISPTAGTQAFNAESAYSGQHILGAMAYQRGAGSGPNLIDESWNESTNKEWADIMVTLDSAPPVLGCHPAQLLSGAL